MDWQKYLAPLHPKPLSQNRTGCFFTSISLRAKVLFLWFYKVLGFRHLCWKESQSVQRFFIQGPHFSHLPQRLCLSFDHSLPISLLPVFLIQYRAWSSSRTDETWSLDIIFQIIIWLWSGSVFTFRGLVSVPQRVALTPHSKKTVYEGPGQGGQGSFLCGVYMFSGGYSGFLPQYKTMLAGWIGDAKLHPRCVFVCLPCVRLVTSPGCFSAFCLMTAKTASSTPCDPEEDKRFR